ncbi:MAG: preprotein translocase subunit SecE [Planctomyces sp.]|nr:preprotein translocase subunit SecE [Planctomyces sp.]
MSGKEATLSVLPELFRFGIYKPNQGRLVRQFTFFALVTIAAMGCLTLANGPLGQNSVSVKIGVPMLIWVVCAWVSYRVVNVPRFADFLVSVESERVKITWPEKPEVTQATIVVLATMVFLGAFLLIVDVVWQKLFSIIRFVEYL